MARSADVTTPLARLAFTNSLFEPQTRQDGKKRWSCTLLFPKGADLSILQNAALDACVAEWGDKARDMVANKLIHSPFLDGDGSQGRSKKTGEVHAGFAGTTFVRVISGEDYRPKLVDKNVLPITGKDGPLYSGAYGVALVNAFTWENKDKGKGVSFSVQAIQVQKDGERLGGSGGIDPEKIFDKVEDAGPTPAAAKTGDGAGALFG